jgi:hypothetical protein
VEKRLRGYEAIKCRTVGEHQMKRINEKTRRLKRRKGKRRESKKRENLTDFGNFISVRRGCFTAITRRTTYRDPGH